MSDDEINKASLDRAKRAILRGLNSDKGTIAALFENNPSQESASQISACLDSWKESLTRLEQIDLDLMECIEEGKTAVEIEKAETEIAKDFSKFKTDYLLAKGKLSTLLAQLSTPTGSTPSRHSLIPSASFIEAPLVNPLLKLQDIPVPKFDGKRQNFTDWQNEFVSTIHDNENLTDFQKMYLLKRAMTGEAEALLKDFTLSGDMYKSAFDHVKERFFNKRVIIATHFAELIDLPEIKIGTMRSSLDTIQRSMRGLDVCGLDSKKMSPLITFIIARKLPERLRSDWANSNHDYSTYPSFESLSTFMSNRCFAYESSHVNAVENISKNTTLSGKSPSTVPATERKSKSSFATTTKKVAQAVKCVCCSQLHYLSSCPKFMAMTIPDRRAFVEEKRLCFNCLRVGHAKVACRSSKCRTCDSLHHTMLHSAENPNPLQASEPTASGSKSTFSLVSKKSHAVLLPTAIVNVRIGFRVIKARALIDACSQINVVSESFVRACQIKVAKSDTVVVGLSPEGVRSTGSVSLNLESRTSDYKITVTAEIAVRIPYEVGPEILHTIAAADPKIELADRGYGSSAVDLLIGGEFANEILLKEKLCVDGLWLQESRLGWIAAGPIRTRRRVDMVSCNLTVTVQDVLARFWEVEEIDPPKVTSSDHELCEMHFLATHSRLPDGRFQVRLPFKKDARLLADTRNQARRALLHYEAKLDRASRTMYVDFMTEFRQLGHMEPARNSTATRPYFIPHLPVLRPDSSTTALRVVFNASAKNSTGISLNQALLIGPVLQPDLFDVLLKFRVYPVAFSADISKMYRQIVVHPDDRHVQTILWRDNPGDVISSYELTTLTYGTAPASYIATKYLQIVGKEIEEKLPDASAAIMSDFYMDDLLTGADTVPEAMSKQRQIHEALLSAKFPLRKYVSNSPVFLQSLDPSLTEPLKPVSFASAGAAKVLGLQWHPQEDEFRVRVKAVNIENVALTKRLISSLVASIFDPLGLVTPFTIRGKILLQDLWREERDWDEPVSVESAIKFREFCSELDELPRFAVKRPLFFEKTTFDLVGFCDASNRAYGAVIYAKSRNNHVPEYTLICSKTKVAPVKALTIPRLELLGAVLLTKLLSRVSKLFKFELSSVKAFCDSTIVLAWLKGPPSRYETFVRNRIEYVTSILPHECWNYVNTSVNPADLLTRGIAVSALINNELWLYGPKSVDEQAEFGIELPRDLPEMRKKQPVLPAILVSSAVSTDEPIISRFSNFDKLVRIMTRVLSFIARVRTRDHKTTVNRDDVLNSIYRVSQLSWFPEDLRALQKSSLPSRSPLASLEPFIDDHGIIRAGGRLEKSSLSYDVKHPVVLSAKSALAKLLARRAHENYYHASQAFISAFLKQRYWLLGGSARLVKNTVKTCVWCTRMKAVTAAQIMGDLPKHRVTVSRPFATTGVDFMGPFTVKCTNHRTQKRLKYYAAVFVCFATRAVHLEAVADLTTKAFVETLQNFVGRRGVPHTMWSDNATNFVGTRNLIDEFCGSRGMTWKFIPPRSPHHGGIWEAAVKVCKKHLLAASRDTVLTADQLKTILVVIESIMNSRPLYARQKANAHGVIDVITPGHFLTGSHLLEPPPVERDLIPLFERLDYQRKVVTTFWSAWRKDYLAILQTRSKWKAASPNLQIGDIVLLKDDTCRPSCWPLGRIIDGKPDSHSRLRIITVQTSTARYLRTVQQVVRLPIDPTPPRAEDP